MCHGKANASFILWMNSDQSGKCQEENNFSEELLFWLAENSLLSREFAFLHDLSILRPGPWLPYFLIAKPCQKSAKLQKKQIKKLNIN